MPWKSSQHISSRSYWGRTIPNSSYTVTYWKYACIEKEDLIDEINKICEGLRRGYIKNSVKILEQLIENVKDGETRLEQGLRNVRNLLVNPLQKEESLDNLLELSEGKELEQDFIDNYRNNLYKRIETKTALSKLEVIPMIYFDLSQVIEDLFGREFYGIKFSESAEKALSYRGTLSENFREILEKRALNLRRFDELTGSINKIGFDSSDENVGELLHVLLNYKRINADRLLMDFSELVAPYLGVNGLTSKTPFQQFVPFQRLALPVELVISDELSSYNRLLDINNNWGYIVDDKCGKFYGHIENVEDNEITLRLDREAYSGFPDGTHGPFLDLHINSVDVAKITECRFFPRDNFPKWN